MACCGTALLLFAYRHTKDNKNKVQREKSTLEFTKHNNDSSVTNKPYNTISLLLSVLTEF
jgi:hypothetical protein